MNGGSRRIFALSFSVLFVHASCQDWLAGAGEKTKSPLTLHIPHVVAFEDGND